VPWSHPDTLRALLARLAPYRVSLISSLRDLDEAADLAAWQTEAKERHPGTPLTGRKPAS